MVEQSLNGQSDRIKQYTVAVEALGYKADFDPVTNPTIRMQARRLRQALDQYYRTQDSDDPTAGARAAVATVRERSP